MCEIYSADKNTSMVILTIMFNAFLPLVNAITKLFVNSCIVFITIILNAYLQPKKFVAFSLKVIFSVILPIVDVGTDINFTWSCFTNGDVRYGWVSGKLYLNLYKS